MKHVIENLKKHNSVIYMMITGGGTGAISKLLESGGASEVFLGAEVPYGYCSTRKPDKFVSEQYAKDLAYTAAGMLDCELDNPIVRNKAHIGVSCTASLYKEGQREDRKNEAWLGLFINDERGIQELTRYLDLKKWKLPNRGSQESFLSEQVLIFLNEYLTGAIL